MKIIYNIGHQGRLPESGLNQMYLERNILEAMPIENNHRVARNLTNRTVKERIIIVHPKDHKGISPCNFEYSIDDYVEDNGKEAIVGSLELSSKVLQEMLEKVKQEERRGQ